MSSLGIFSDLSFNSDKIIGSFGIGYANGYGLSMTSGLNMMGGEEKEGLFCGVSSSGAFNGSVGKGYSISGNLDLKSLSVEINMGVGFGIGSGFSASFGYRGTMER